MRSPTSVGSLGVVVVHYGSPESTVRCVRSILNDPSPVHREVVVVDNSNNFATSLGVQILPSPDNPGFGEGANRGIRALAAKGLHNYVVLNHDVEILPGFLHAVVMSFQMDRVGAVGGPLYFPDRRTLWSAGGFLLWPLGVVIQHSSYRWVWRAREVGFLPGAALALRGSAFASVGGFDPRFFLYHEDLDICLRLRRAGWRLWFSPKAAAVHHVGMATGSFRHSSEYLEHLTRTRLLPFRPLAFRLWLAVVHSVYALARAGKLALSSRREEALAVLRGHRAALANIGAAPMPVTVKRKRFDGVDRQKLGPRG